VPVRAHIHTPQTVVTTTEADLRNALHQHIGAIEARRAWIGPFGVALTIAITLIVGIKDDTWRALLFTGLGASALWCGNSIFRAWRCRKHAGIDAVIREITRG
jgi:hypothetical protein